MRMYIKIKLTHSLGTIHVCIPADLMLRPILIEKHTRTTTKMIGLTATVLDTCIGTVQALAALRIQLSSINGYEVN